MENRRKKRSSSWARLPAERLLDVRLCDLKLLLPGTTPGRRVQRLFRELGVRGLSFRPHVWIGEEWFTPDGVPGFGVFAGLNVLPKPTYMNTYSCRCTEAQLMKLQSKIVSLFNDKYADFYSSDYINLDFHSVPF